MSRTRHTNNELLQLKEKLAAIEHERWGDWQAWIHTLYETNNDMFETYIERWKKQIATPYEELSVNERLSDLKQVDRYWPLIEAHISKKERRADYLNDALRRAAEFMYQNGLLPPDTTTIDGIRSYFLNEARFKEARLNKGDNDG